MKIYDAFLFFNELDLLDKINSIEESHTLAMLSVK